MTRDALTAALASAEATVEALRQALAAMDGELSDARPLLQDLPPDPKTLAQTRFAPVSE